jgi:hypothetical protein
MKLNYINKIKANVSIYSTKKTSNILDGSYKSIYIGKSLNFENLREYVINDDVKDIDWKSSTRTNTLLVKQFIAEKKHNILLVMDTGIKMNADTDTHENKKEVALYTAGTLGYIALKNNDSVSMIYKKNDKYEFKPFKNNLYNLEEYLCSYDKDCTLTNGDINDTLEFINKNIQKKMILLIVTDIDGMQKIKTKTLRKLNLKSDILLVNINDNYMIGNDIFDVSDSDYIPEFILKNKKLNDLEKQVKRQIMNNNKAKFKRAKVNYTTINSIKEINIKLIQLLKEHAYAIKN